MQGGSRRDGRVGPGWLLTASVARDKRPPPSLNARPDEPLHSSGEFREVNLPSSKTGKEGENRVGLA